MIGIHINKMLGVSCFKQRRQNKMLGKLKEKGKKLHLKVLECIRFLAQIYHHHADPMLNAHKNLSKEVKFHSYTKNPLLTL